MRGKKIAMPDKKVLEESRQRKKDGLLLNGEIKKALSNIEDVTTTYPASVSVCKAQRNLTATEIFKKLEEHKLHAGNISIPSKQYQALKKEYMK